MNLLKKQNPWRARYGLVATCLACLLAVPAMAQGQGNIGAFNVDWSPDGKTLAFMANWDGDWEIYLMDVDGTNMRQLTDNEAHDIIPFFSADGARILYSSTTTGNWDIHAIDVAGGEPRPLIASAEYNEREPQEIADGRIAYVWSDPKDPDRSDLRVWDPRTGETEILVGDGSKNARGSWSPSGDRFVFSSNKSGKEEIYVADWDGSNRRQLTSLPEGLYRVGSAWPVFAPDGRSIVYWGDAGGAFYFDHHHYVLDLETGEETMLPKRILSMAYPGLSPDGMQIVYAASLGGGTKVRIFVMNIDGSDHKTIWPPE